MTGNYWSNAYGKRIGRRRVMAVTGAAVAGAGLLAACGGSGDGDGGEKASGLLTSVADESKNAKHGGVLKHNLGATNITDFEPYISPNAFMVIPFTYGGLLAVKEGYLKYSDGELVGDGAESWELSPDRLTLTFKINPNTHFASVAPVNGRALDAKDVAASWERFKSIGTQRSEFANEFNPAAPILSITATDDRTVVLKLKEPNATIYSFFARDRIGNFFMVPKEALDAKVLDVKKVTAGTGPWYVTDWQPSLSFTLKRNAAFRQFKGELPYIDQIDTYLIAEYAAQVAQFRAGAVYINAQTRAEDMLPLKRDLPQLELYQTDWAAAGQRLYLSARPNQPFIDERVRQAFVMTWDRDLYLGVVFNLENFREAGIPVQIAKESGLRMGGWEGWFLDPASREFGPNAKFFNHDLTLAKQLLAAAGYPNGIDTICTTPAQAANVPGTVFNGLEALIAMTQDSGLFRMQRKTNNYIAEWIPMRQSKGQGYDGISYGPGAIASPDPTQELYAQYNPTSNYSQGSDSTMESLTDRAMKEFDDKKRLELVREIQRYEGGKFFYPLIGSAQSLNLNWPVVRNWGVFRGGTGQKWANLFMDPEKAPLKSG